MKTVELTWLRTLKIWWYWAWRSMLMTMVVALIAGIFVGLLAAPFFASDEQLELFSNVLGGVIALFFSLYVMKSLPEKRFSDFRVVLVPRNALDESEPAKTAPEPGRFEPDAENSPANLPSS